MFRSRAFLSAILLFGLFSQQAQAFMGLTQALLLLPASQLPKAKLTLCYISLNNDREFIETKAFIDKIQAITGKNLVEVTEFQKKGQSPEQTVRDLIQNKVVCNGLVISGHHTGAFGGARSGGSLSIDFLERISCEADSSKWFLNIQSLWLQGCRTLGATTELQQQQNMDLANFHGARVGAVREADHLQQGQWDLVNEFANVLDSETPYASRFMKSFSHAKIFGWTETAPGEKASSDKSLPYHIHNVALQLVSSSGQTIKLSNPFAPKISPAAAQAYQDALVTILMPPRTVKTLKASLEGWKLHGSPDPSKGIYGLYNSKLNAHPPLVGSEDTWLLKTRDLECKVRNASTFEVKMSHLKSILADERLIALSFYTLRDILRKADRDTAQSKIIRETMAASTKLTSFLKMKLSSKHLGIVRKVEYFAFVRDVTGEINQELYTVIKKEAWDLLLQPADAANYTVRDFKSRLIAELARSKMLSYEELVELINKAPDKSLVAVCLSAIQNYSTIMPNVGQLLTQIERRWPIEGDLASQMISAIGYSRTWNPDFERIVKNLYRKILSTPAQAPGNGKWSVFQSLFYNREARFPELTEIFVKYRDDQLAIIDKKSQELGPNDPYTESLRTTLLGASLATPEIDLAVADSTAKSIIAYFEKKGLTAQNIHNIASQLFSSVYDQSRFTIVIPPNRQYILDFVSRNAELIAQSETNGNHIRNTLLRLCARYSPQKHERVVEIIFRQAQVSGSEMDKKIIPDFIRSSEWTNWGKQPNYISETLFKSILATIPPEADYFSGFAKYATDAGYNLSIVRNLYSRFERSSDLNENKLCMLMMAYGKSKLSLEERKAAIQRFQRHPSAGHLMPACTLMTAIIAPDLFQNVIALADQYTSTPEHEPYVRGVAVLVYGLSDLPAPQRTAKIESIVRSNAFTGDSLQVLSPSLMVYTGISNMERYMEVLRTVAAHRQIEDEEKIKQWVWTVNSAEKLSEAQKAEIRRLFQLPEKVNTDGN
ncbi:MAG: hypothetical protein IT289_07505 [Oligoflexia bacterium]|nr:hypothetical protein [Oligoflexia bacterium]